MKNKKITATLTALAATFTAVSFSACGGKKTTIELAGSTSVEPLMGVLADAYMSKHKDVEVRVEGGGSSVGVSNAKEGKGDFGMASKSVSEDGVTAVKICDDGIVVVVNKENALTDVTGEQLYEFYTAGTPIGVATLPVARESGSGTRDAFEELVKNAEGDKLKDQAVRASNTKEFNTTGGALTEIRTSAVSLGYISLGSYEDSVKKLTFNGVEGTAENIKNGSYQLARPFNILYNTEKGLSEAARSFLNFILSDEGQAIVAEEGYVTL